MLRRNENTILKLFFFSRKEGKESASDDGLDRPGHS